MDININLTMNSKTYNFTLNVEASMMVEDFFTSLQQFLYSFKMNTKKDSTFDIYNLSFERIALIGQDDELLIEHEYKSVLTTEELVDKVGDTIEIITLGKTSIKKVVEEEKLLKDALENYHYDVQA